MPTIYDVARAANVSIASVSLVMNDPATPRVGSAKRRKIMEIAARLGYSPNGIAKALTHGETRILGLMIPMRDPIFVNHFIAQVLSGIQVAVLAHGYHLMIYSHQADTGQITGSELRHSRFVDGLIVLNTRMCSEDDQQNTAKELSEAGIPFVMTNGVLDNTVNSVRLDDYGAGQLGGTYLMGRGHRRIAVLSASRNSPLSQVLLDGFKSALRKKDLHLPKDLHVYCEYDHNIIREATKNWISGPRRPTAIFATDDQFVPTIYRTVQESGLAIPEDIAVLGRGDMSLGTAVEPELTTIAVPAFQLGNEAAELLIKVLRNPRSEPTNVILPCNLVKRASI
jgi:DNA-binding LacI/PurR family transcriptional regulator